MSDERFIPYEQIEPLLKPGMTLRELGNAIRVKAGLPRHVYALVVTGDEDESVASKVRRGCWIIRRNTPRWQACRYSPNEPVQ